MAQGKNRMLMRLNANSRKNNPLVDISSYLYFLVRVARQGGGKRKPKSNTFYQKESLAAVCACIFSLYLAAGGPNW